jgi:hypothetical protein
MMDPRKWCTTLGGLCSPSFPADAIEALVDMIPLVEARYGLEAFNILTLADIAAMKRRQSCPSFDEICTVMTAAFKERLPASVRMGASPFPALPIPDLRPPSQEACDHIDAQVAAFKADMAAQQRAKAPEVHKVTPKYLSGLALALARENAGIPLSPVLRAALTEHRSEARR